LEGEGAVDGGEWWKVEENGNLEIASEKDVILKSREGERKGGLQIIVNDGIGFGDLCPWTMLCMCTLMW
jgi:hypothetical protein